MINDFLTNGSANMSKNNDFDSHLGRYSNGGHMQLSYDSRDSSFDQDLDDPGPHREMAIDVPENFVASVKSPPRYPPPMPRSHPVTSPSKTRGDNSQTNSKSTNSKSSNQSAIQPTPQELERLHRHQEDLKVTILCHTHLDCNYCCIVFNCILQMFFFLFKKNINLVFVSFCKQRFKSIYLYQNGISNIFCMFT